jgi:ribosomal protein S18 acetylase RimI-like enzyme
LSPFYSITTTTTQQNEIYGRFTQSFIKQFAQKEAMSLTKRTAGGKDAECITLVILPSSSSSSSPDQPPQQQSQAQGSLDIRPPASHNSRHPQGVPPQHSKHSGYVLNVVVQSGERRKGLGRQLVEEAKRLARQEWNAEKLYAHVDAVNDAAIGCYQACGFEVVPEDDDDEDNSDGDVPRLKNGCRLLLCCQL